MSAVKQSIDVFPDRYSDKEVKQVRGFECPRCNGQGGFTEQTSRDKFIFKPCDLCGGAKKVKAAITIEWDPDFGS